MEKPMRILQVLGKLNRGGAETMIMNLYRKIDRMSIQFDFMIHTNEKCDYEDEIMKLGGKIHRVPRYTGKNHISYVGSWKSFLNRHPEYRIVHGHVRSTAAIYLKIANDYGRKTIAHSHSTSSGTGINALVKNIFKYPIRFRADYLLACSDRAGRWLFGKSILGAKNYYVLKNAIDIHEFVFNETVRQKKRKELKVEGKFVVGHVGRFHFSKNHEKLIDIFYEIHKYNPDAKLLLIGDGELRGSIQEKVLNLGLKDAVIFTGVREDIPELYQAMDVLVLPSLYEGLGIVLIEAQAAGLPCVVSERIPDEAKITKRVISCNILDSNSYWAEVILKCRGDRRKTSFQEIKRAGYDITDTSKWVSNFYRRIIQG